MDLTTVRTLKSLVNPLDDKNFDLVNELKSWEEMFSTQTQVLGNGSVRLDGVLADDLSVVNSARVSFGKQKERMETADEKLVGFLMRNRHGTPFEHNIFRFHIVAPIFVFREWHRHRIASYNEFSGRYSEFNPTFYIPKREDVRTQVGKPGAYRFEQADEAATTLFLTRLENWVKDGEKFYQWSLEEGIAKEQARFFLANNVFSEMYFTVNARSLMNFISLRNSPDAQYEIRVYAAALESHFEKLMPVTYGYFVESNRVSP